MCDSATERKINIANEAEFTLWNFRYTSAKNNNFWKSPEVNQQTGGRKYEKMLLIKAIVRRTMRDIARCIFNEYRH